MGNMNQTLQGFHSLPTPYNDANGLIIKMWNLNGTITTPWFGEDFVEEYYQEDKDILLALELPDNTKDLVGSGSFIIELEIDTINDKGWVEDVIVYTLHTTGKTWSEAEIECQKEGGHLASVTSEEVNQMVTDMAGNKYIWLGGKRDDKDWSWSDDSAWEYTRWGQNVNDMADCVRFITGEWYKYECSRTSAFVCQKARNLRSKKILRLAYTKDLSFTKFLLLYKYKSANKKLLDSLKNKRMTGFRLSWRIENPYPPLTANINEVGRSIKTPNHGDKLDKISDASNTYTYRAILTPSKDLLKQMKNRNLLIELDINMGPSDEVYAFTNYKLYREWKTWPQADAHCKSEGGQLASIHSRWEHTLALEAAQGEQVWLGGRIDAEGEWQWADNTTWSFTNWPSGSSGNGEYLTMDTNGVWYRGYGTFLTNFYLCQGASLIPTKDGLESIELKKVCWTSYHSMCWSRAKLAPSQQLTTQKGKGEKFQVLPSTGLSKITTAPY